MVDNDDSLEQAEREWIEIAGKLRRACLKTVNVAGFVSPEFVDACLMVQALDAGSRLFAKNIEDQQAKLYCDGD